MIIAHRGYTKNHSENTIAAFDAAFKAGADAVETDLRLASDLSVIVSHNPVKDKNKVLTLDQLFDYIKTKTNLFFLELKSSDKILLEKTIKKISENNLWEQTHLIGFGSNIKTALAVQDQFSKLLVDQIIMVPYLHYVKSPKKSNAVFFGWLDGVKYSELLFKFLVSRERIVKFKQMYESLGFKVLAGIPNSKEGIMYFQKAGIYDIFTDEVELAKICLKQQ